MACHTIKLQTVLEAVAIRTIIFNRLITPSFIYITPGFQLSSSDFDGLVDQLPEPLIMKVTSMHTTLFGTSRTDSRGRLIETFPTSSGASLFNKNKHTYYNIGHNVYSRLDLAIGTAVLFPSLEWEVGTNPLGGDHFFTSLTNTDKGLPIARLPK